MKYCAIIPARGQSKRLHRKNLVLIDNKPLIAHTIQIAHNTEIIDKVVVSTDDDEIAKVSKEYGAEIVRRPASISGDYATSESAVLHSLKYLEDEEIIKPDVIILLQATSPVRQSDDLEKAISLFEEKSLDSLFTAASFPGFLWKELEGELSPVNFDYLDRPRHQDTPNYYMENGSFFIFKTSVIKKYKNRMGGKIGVYTMPMLNSFELDNPEDIDLIEILMKNTKNNFSKTELLSKIKLIVFDFDGVMTNNKVYVSQEGVESVICDRSDSLGISRLKDLGYDLLVLSTEKNKVVQSRCKKLNLEVIHGSDNKLEDLTRYIESKNLLPENVAYVGNDVNDLECMEWVGISIAVGDADYRIKEKSTLITSRNGGNGAVREVCDWFEKL